MRPSIISLVLVHVAPMLGCSVTAPLATEPAPVPSAEAPRGDADASAAEVVPATATPPDDALHAAIDAIVRPEIDPSGANAKIVGAAVAIIAPGVRAVVGYGVTAIGGREVPAADTIFEIGSNTKPMTGLVLAQEVAAGALALDTPVSALLPAGAAVPTHAGAPIRLVHLATHTSGLPDFPDNMVGRPPAPAAGYTEELLFDFLAGHTLASAPGSKMAYSNLGFGLLGVALQRAEGAARYEAMFRAHVGEPLGMKDTWVTVPAASASRVAGGSRQGRTMPPVQIDTLEASGALRSTGADMLAFVAANLAPPASMKAAVVLSQAVHAEVDGKEMALGFSVETEGGRTTFSKGGGTPGFTSHVSFTTAPPAGVVVLTNTGQADAVKPMTEKILAEVIAAAKRP